MSNVDGSDSTRKKLANEASEQLGRVADIFAALGHVDLSRRALELLAEWGLRGEHK